MMTFSVPILSGLLTVAISLAVLINHRFGLLPEHYQMAGLALIAGNACLTVVAIWLEKRQIRNSPELLTQLTSNSPDWEQARRQLKTELQQEIDRLEQKSQKLADRYRSLHEWMDYPNILDVQTGSALWSETVPETPAPRQRLTEQDRRVKEILARQAELIYEKIRKNSYSEAGQLQPLRLRDDFVNMAVEVAHVYQPELSQPLLSTSPEQLARALNRIGLHLLVIMDQLPIDLKSYNIQKTYDTIRQAITAYGAYKKAAPYLDWASKGIYLGRMVSTSNPVTLGLFWGATELGKYGAKKLATHLIDRQAIGLLQSLIEVIGYEVAGIYGGDFRHRDANWTYAVELTHMLAIFPVSRESLQLGYREISRLQLKNEYDRLCAFRCLAAGKSLDRRQTYPELLSHQEKKEIVSLLESAYQNVLHGKSDSQTETWRKQVEDHLGMKLHLERKAVAKIENLTLKEQSAEGRFLAEFLLHMKQIPVDQLPQTRVQLLLQTQGDKPTRAVLAEPFSPDLLDSVSRDDEQRLLPPDLEPSDPRLDTFLQTLSDTNAIITPWTPEAELLILELGLYYRKELQELTDRLLHSYRDQLITQHPNIREILKGKSLSVYRAIGYLHQERGISVAATKAVYEHVKVNCKVELPPELSPTGLRNLLLLVSESGAFLVSADELPNEMQILWESNQETTWQNASSLITASLILRGGVWQQKELKDAELFVEAPLSARFHTYFSPLTERTRQQKS